MLNKAICICFAFLLIGCAQSHVQVVYKEVKVPVGCDVQIPDRPTMTSDVMSNMINIISYTKILEERLKICIK